MFIKQNTIFNESVAAPEGEHHIVKLGGSLHLIFGTLIERDKEDNFRRTKNLVTFPRVIKFFILSENILKPFIE